MSLMSSLRRSFLSCTLSVGFHARRIGVRTYHGRPLCFAEPSIWVRKVGQRVDDFLVDAMAIDFALQARAIAFAMLLVVNCRGHLML